MSWHCRRAAQGQTRNGIVEQRRSDRHGRRHVIAEGRFRAFDTKTGKEVVATDQLRRLRRRYARFVVPEADLSPGQRPVIERLSLH